MALKTILAGGLAATLALSVSMASAAEKKSLVFVVNGASDFWKIAEAGVKKAQAELPNYNLELKYPEQAAAAVQQRVMDDLVASGAAAIMVSAVDPKNQTEGLDKIASQTLLFTTDSDAPQSKRIAYIGSSNTDLGKEAGKLMLKALPDGGKCIGFVGLPGADNARERIEGVKETLKGSKVRAHRRARRRNRPHPRQAQRRGRARRQSRTSACLVGFYSYNTPRIYEVVKEDGKLGKIKIIGFDEDPIVLGGVKEGAIVGTVVQQPFEWGYQGMKLMAKVVEGDKSGIPANGVIIVPTKVIDQSNVDGFMASMKTMLGK